MTPPAADSGPRSTHEGDWICANCGAVAESNDQPCRECAGERFARLEPESTPDIDSTVSVRYRCKECGETQPRNSTPCKECGNLTFKTISGSDPGGGFSDRGGQRGVPGTETSWNWIHPPGPFQTLRQYTFYFAAVTLPLSIAMFVLGILPSLAIVWMLLVWPWIAGAWGLMWVADNILGYLRHG